MRTFVELEAWKETAQWQDFLTCECSMITEAKLVLILWSLCINKCVSNLTKWTELQVWKKVSITASTLLDCGSQTCSDRIIFTSWQCLTLMMLVSLHSATLNHLIDSAENQGWQKQGDICLTHLSSAGAIVVFNVSEQSFSLYLTS